MRYTYCMTRFLVFWIPLLFINQSFATTERLDAIYKELEDFQTRGLPYSLQIEKYLRYEQETGLTGKHHNTITELKKSDPYPKARKASCKDQINLKKPLSLDRPKNQDSVNWCFSYAASDLIANETGEEPSAAYVGLNTLKYFSNPGDGFIGKIINGIKKNGTCTESTFNSSDYRFSEKYKDYEIAQLGDDLLKFYKVVTDGKKTKQEAVSLFCSETKMADSIKEFFPGMSEGALVDLILAYRKDKDSYVLASMVNGKCPVKKIPALNNLNPKFIDRVNTSNWSEVDKVISQGKILGIEYDAGILTKYDYSPDPLSGHASSIVGRRWNDKTNSCEYLLRNSWGKPCSGYSEDYECNNGHIWMAESFFQYQPVIRRAVYLDKVK